MISGLVLFAVLIGCHGDDNPAMQTLVFRELPANSDPYPPHHLILRTNFEGSVEFIESSTFLIEVNVTAGNVHELAKVHYDYTDLFGSIMLQLYSAEPAPLPFILSQEPINYILLTLGGATGLAFLISLVYVCWWNVARRPAVEEEARHKALSPDSSQAPLLEGRPMQDGQTPDMANRARKHRKKPTNRPLAPGEEYMSSEDDGGSGDARGGRGSPQKHYTLPRGAPQHGANTTDMELYATVRKHDLSSEGLLTNESTPLGSQQMDVKPVVSYIKIHGDDPDAATLKKLGQSQYVPLNKEGTLDSRYSDLEKQATLKVRRGDSYEDTMPDVIKSRTMPHHQQTQQRGIDTSAGRRGVDSGRYVSLKPTAPPQQTPEPKEPEYSTVNKQLTGAQIAHMISGDRSRQSPKFSHNTDRTPTTFMAGHRGPANCDDRLELDSVGSSRSGESTSGAGTSRTQVSSPFSVDSDKSSSSSNSKFVLQNPPPGRYSSSGITDHSSDSGHGGSNPRLVDEAYGTMGGGNNNTSNTLRSSSTASTGSGSSGSVVTVVAADGDGTLGRGRKYGTPRNNNSNGGGGMGRSPNKYLHASIVCSICLVSIAMGVHSQLVAKTTAHIRVYAPVSYLKYRPQVFYRAGLKINVSTEYELQKLDVERFEVPDARVYDKSVDKCKKNCNHGCDANTGQCVCRLGYRLGRKHNKCEDIDECRENADDCSSRAMCENLPGSYRCKCRPLYYGEDNVCYACTEPCRNGTYEVMGCQGSNPKVCQECMKTCMDGYYIKSPCKPTSETDCQPCKEKCAFKQYEYTPCFGQQDRTCSDIDSLPKPQMSKNLIYEDQRQVMNVLSKIIPQDWRDSPIQPTVTMVRGSGFSVQLTVKESNLAPLYRSVDHSDSNDNEEVDASGHQHIRNNYCAYPLPEKYKLTHRLHKSITTKAKFYSCNKRRRQDDEKCEMVTGYYLDPREVCMTYENEPLGKMPSLDTKDRSVLCTKAARLTEVFNVGADLSEITIMFVDKEKKCSEARTKCDHCSQACANNMKSYHGSHRCNITGEDPDNGESPRLPNCYSCCAREDCAQACKVYHDPECEERRCIVGNLAEFVLEAEFSRERTTFACHVEPVPDYKYYDIEYVVMNNRNVVNERRLRAVKVFEGKHPEKSIDVHGFLKVYHGSYLSARPDMVHGETSMEAFSAGTYQVVGTSLGDASPRGSSVKVRPRRPFSVSTQSWKREPCESPVLDDLVMVDSAASASDNEPFRRNHDIRVIPGNPQQYRLFNMSAHDPQDKKWLPFIYFEVPGESSILKAVYNDTTVKEDQSLKAELTRQPHQWDLIVKGRINICPGYFGIKVTDPAYMRSPLFHYDIGVNCPSTFSLNFTVPTEGPDDYDKKLLVEITDSFRKIKLTVFRPAPNETTEAKDSAVHYGQKGEKQMTIFTPFIAVLCVIISFLTLLLFVGFITERGKKAKKSENKVHSQHLLFVVCYVTFRAGYSIVVTFTVLLLLVRHFNRDSLTTLTEFKRYAETAENDQRLAIDHIQGYVMDELKRQNALANDTKFVCEKKLAELQNVLEDQKQQMRVENNEEKLVSQMALQYTKLMILNLTHDISTFREEFTVSARKAVDQLERNVVQTMSALRSNKWLEAAKLIHASVQQKRKAQGQETKGFEDWAGIQQEVQGLSVDLSLKNFPMPNLTEYLNIDIPRTNTKQSSIPRISDINLPQNKWYYQFEKKASINAAGKMRPKRPRFKVSGNDIISWSSLIAILVVIDLIWFVHRMAKTYSTAKMILYGCPSFVDCRKSDPMHRKPTTKRSVSSRCFNFLKDFNLRVMKTEFVPKLVATATTCCAVYLILASSDQLLTVKTLASVGYFESMVAPVETSYRLAKTRVKTNSYRINKFEYPFYEKLVNVRTKRYQLMLDMYAELQKSNNLLHDSEYCAWRKLLHPGEECNCTTASAETLKFEGCELPPVTPHAYQKPHRKDFGAYRDQLSRTIVPYINASRQVVMDTCHLVMIFVAVLVMVDALGAVTWIYLKRFNLLRLKPMFEIEQYPAPETMGNHT